MGGSYRQCSECGKRALSIATRCPGCGRELEPQVTPARPAVEVGRYFPQGVVAAVALAAVILAV
jgi:predicted amidophosphoribosyltransferase